MKLIREETLGKAVRGVLYVQEYDVRTDTERMVEIGRTLENKDYMVLPLIYRVEVTHSPKFNRLLPVLCGVPRVANDPERGMRSGIRIHSGSRPEHSKGCILMTDGAKVNLVTQMVLKCQREREEVRMEIEDRG